MVSIGLIGIVGLFFLLGLILALVWLIARLLHDSGKEMQRSERRSRPSNRAIGPHPQRIGPEATTAACPECGSLLPADSPEGLCPRCLLGPVLESPMSPAVSPAGGPGAFTAPAPADLAAHFPQLEILELLGQGGMGAVYKARQIKLDRLVALKVLPAEWGRDPAFAERFAREARALARLNHPNIVAVHDFGEAGGHF
jgi:hypothetical protein